MGLRVINSKKEFDSKVVIESNNVNHKTQIDKFLSKVTIKPLSLSEIDNARLKAYNPIC